MKDEARYHMVERLWNGQNGPPFASHDDFEQVKCLASAHAKAMGRWVLVLEKGCTIYLARPR